MIPILTVVAYELISVGCLFFGVLILGELSLSGSKFLAWLGKVARK